MSQQPMTKTWLKLTITCPQEQSDAIASFLTDLTGCGVEQSISSDQDNTPETITGYLEQGGDSTRQEQKLDQHLQKVAAAFPDLPAPSLTIQTFADEDWNSKWKAQFKPFHITPHLVIKPTWEDHSPADDDKVIEIDPGMAFGTGHHASTKLALEFIESLFLDHHTTPQSVLDVGTGTGILAMAATLFGAENVLAVDNDPEAVLVAQDNIALNRLSNTIQAADQRLETISEQYDLVVANIIHDTLVELAPQLSSRVKSNGLLILAGILSGTQCDNICKVYAELGLHCQEIRTEGEWSSILLKAGPLDA